MVRILSEEKAAEFIAKNFKKGDILRWESFKGAKQIKDRFFILLTPYNGENFLAVTANSHTNLYLDIDGKRSQREFVFVEKGRCDNFAKDTILDLNWIEEFNVQEMAKLFGEGITRQGQLSEDLLKEIDARVQTSRHISKIRRDRILSQG